MTAPFTPTPFLFSRYPSSLVFASLESFRPWLLKHRPTVDTLFGQNRHDTLVHALMRNGAAQWLTPELWESFGFTSAEFKRLANSENSDGATAFHVALSLEKPVERQQALALCLQMDPAMAETPFFASSYNRQSTLIHFLETWADRNTDVAYRATLKQTFDTVYEHGGHTPCSVHPIQYVTCLETLRGVLPEVSHPVFDSCIDEFALVREPRHRTMRGMSDAWKGEISDRLAVKNWLTSNLDLAKKMRYWLCAQGTSDRLEWWSRTTGVSLSEPLSLKNGQRVTLSEHFAKLSSVRSQNLPRAETKRLSAALFLRENASSPLKEFNERFCKATFSGSALLHASDFTAPLPHSLDSMRVFSEDLFSDTGNPPVSHFCVTQLLFSTHDTVDYLGLIEFLATNSERVSWDAPLQGNLDSDFLILSKLSVEEAHRTPLIDVLRLGVGRAQLSLRDWSDSSNRLERAFQHIERASLLKRVSGQLQDKRTAFAL